MRVGGGSCLEGPLLTELNKTTETTDACCLALVAAAQRQWIDALTDLGGRNTLLYYKDRRAGTPRSGLRRPRRDRAVREDRDH